MNLEIDDLFKEVNRKKVPENNKKKKTLNQTSQERKHPLMFIKCFS